MRNALSLALACTTIAALAFAASCDPVQNDAINSLGDEAPNVRTGPLHRPGQPCLLCHDGKIGDPPQFAVAGTIFEQVGSTAPAVGVEVTMTSVDDPHSTHTAKTNEAGNFYVLPGEWSPGFPFKVTMSRTTNGVETKACMTSHVGRDGSCATCHVDPVTQTSAGHITLVEDPRLVPDGGCP